MVKGNAEDMIYDLSHLIFDYKKLYSYRNIAILQEDKSDVKEITKELNNLLGLLNSCMHNILIYHMINKKK